MWMPLYEFNKLTVICQRFWKMGCEGGRILGIKIPKIDKAETLKSPEQNSLSRHLIAQRNRKNWLPCMTTQKCSDFFFLIQINLPLTKHKRKKRIILLHPAEKEVNIMHCILCYHCY